MVSPLFLSIANNLRIITTAELSRISALPAGAVVQRRFRLRLLVCWSDEDWVRFPHGEMVCVKVFRPFYDARTGIYPLVPITIDQDAKLSPAISIHSQV